MQDDLQQPVLPADPEKLRILVMRSNALRAAITEIMSEQRAEIIRRARAKLLAQGLSSEDADPSGDFL